VQVLTSPSQSARYGRTHPYEALLEDFDQVRPLERHELLNAVAVVAEPNAAWREAFQVPNLSRVPSTRAASACADDLLSEPLVPAETSPLDKRTLMDLAALAGGVFFAATGTIPVVVFVGGTIGLVVVRGLQAVGGALWEGARPSVVALGRDAGEEVVDAIRRRLSLRRRD
jgi:hypothetical protein